MKLRRSPSLRRPQKIIILVGLVVLVLALTVESSTGAGVAPGGLDSTFGSAGKRVVDILDDYAAGGVLQGDGKIVATGIADQEGTDSQLVFARLDANGSLDPTFSGDGIGSVAVMGTEGAVLVATAPALTTDGGYVAGVWEYTESDTATMAPVIAKFTANGNPDASFDGDGFVTLNALSGDQDWVLEVAVDTSGRILALLIDETGASAVARITASGTIDTSFDGDGIRQAAQSESFATFLPISGGKLLVGGARTGTADEFAVWQFTSSGALDTSWGTNGRVTQTTSKTNRYHMVTALATDVHGRVVAGGDTFLKSEPYTGEGWIMRFQPSGSADGEFGSGGKVQHVGSVGNDGVRDLAVQKNGRIAVLGTTDSPAQGEFAVTRYHSDGRLDTEFGSAGSAKVDFHGGVEDAYMWSIAVDAADRIVAVGDILNTAQPQNSDIALARFDGTGFIDIGAYGSFAGGVYSAAGDLNGDGADEVVTGPGYGGGPHVRTFTADGYPGAGWYAYSPGFNGGVRVAAGDVDGDGKDEIITAPGPGGGPHVRIWKADGSVREMTGFMAYGGFSGGVEVAAGDVDGDGKDEVITAPSSGGGPHVRIFDVGTKVTEYAGFMAYASWFSGGVHVGAGDVEGDGKDEVIVGPGPTGGPHIRIFDITSRTAQVRTERFAYSPSFSGGVRVGAGDVDGDGNDEVITGAGPTGGPHVIVWDAATSMSIRQQFMAYAMTFLGGIQVDGADLGADARAEVLISAGAGGGPHVRAVAVE